MWRLARAEEHERVIAMCIGYYAEDPGPLQVTAAQVQRTLAVFERDPSRGIAVVLDIERSVAGYALLVPFYSNGLGGNACEVQELFVDPERRSRGAATALLEALDA